MSQPSPALRPRAIGLVTASLIFTGVGFAATMPYSGIVAIEGLGISNGDYALILTVGSLIGAVASVLLGWLSDRIGDRRRLVITVAIVGTLGPALLWFVRAPWAFVVMSCVLMPFGGAMYSQTLAYARAYLAGQTGSRVSFVMTMIRAAFAVSWVITPPVAGWIAATYTVFDPYAVAALAAVACVAIFLVLLRDPSMKVASGEDEREALAEGGGIPVSMVAGILGVVALTSAMRLNGLATPLAVVTHWGGTVADVGIYAALAAFIEIPFMIVWAYATRRVPLPLLIAAAGLLYAIYVYLAGNVGSVAELLWLQGLNGLATAALVSLPISYVQEAIRGRVGLSTSLLDVIFVASSLLAAGAFALFTARNHYLPIFDVAAVVGLAGAIVMALAFVLERWATSR